MPSSAAGATSSAHHAQDVAQSASASSFRSLSPLAQQMLERDLAECSDDSEVAVDDGDDTQDDSEDLDTTPGPTLYRRPSGIAFGAARPALASPAGLDDTPALTRSELHRSRNEERSLLRDNHILPPKHQHHALKKGGVAGRAAGLYRRLFSTKLPLPAGDEEAAPAAPRIVVVPDESSPLLGQRRRSSAGQHHLGEPETLNEQWDAAVAAGNIRTTWQREAKTIAVYSRSLIVTFLLQYSLNVTSVFAVGRLGTLELAAISLATMSANITCYAPIQGLATSLDTLCAQAFGSGHKHLVGLQLQRMILFLFLLLVPVAGLWLNAESILARMIDGETAALAAIYLRIVLLGAPAYAAFECGKRFVQAQGLFHATTYVLLVAAPVNVFLNWLFVWRFGWGFQGAPLAVAFTQNLLPLLLMLYVFKIHDTASQAWGGFRKAAFKNWGPMVRLALPGFLMVEAEWLAFEILTLVAGRMGVDFLAAQSVLVTITGTTFQTPFALSIASSTRVANLIGAKLVDAAKTSARVVSLSGTRRAHPGRHSRHAADLGGNRLLWAGRWLGCST